MHAGLTILTTADADRAIMELFANTLAASELGRKQHVTWLVVDGLCAYTHPPTLLAGNRLPEMKWITPSAPLPQLNAIMHGLLLTEGPVIIMDPDMSDNIKDIPELMSAHSDGADIVFGRRILRHGIGPLRQLLTIIYNFSARILLGIPIHDLNSPMIFITQNAIDLIKTVPPECPSPRFYVFNQLVDRLGEVPICVYELPKKSSYSLLARTSLGVVRLIEILEFIFWKKKTRLQPPIKKTASHP